MESARRRRDRLATALAARQHDVVAHRQLAALGFPPRTIRARASSGRLHVVHEGIYTLGTPVLTREGRWMAAVLACGDDAVLSHRSAAVLHGLLRHDGPHPDVSVCDRSGRARARIAIHRPRTLLGEEVTRVAGIPVTTPERTLLDLAAVVRRTLLERACDTAERERRIDVAVLVATAEGHRGHPGSRRLRRVLGGSFAEGLADDTRSGLERQFLALCRRHGLPAPAVNQRVAGLEVDFTWSAHRLAVETDTLDYHGTRVAFERDRRRDAQLTAAGWRVMRITGRRLDDDPGAVAGQLRSALGAAGVPGLPRTQRPHAAGSTPDAVRPPP